LNHQAKSNSDIEEELAKISLPNGLIIRIGKEKFKVTKKEIREDVRACYDQDLTKTVSMFSSESSSSESSSSESSSSESSSEQSSPRNARTKMMKAIEALKGGCK